MTSKRLVSLVIITRDEESNIARCIESAKWVDEVVVLDSGSTDRTVEIARSLGARVEVEEWRGYRKQKERVTQLATHDWILSLDADEALSPELSQQLSKQMSQETQGLQSAVDGFECPRLSYHLGRWIWHGGWYPDRQVRFFNRQRCAWSQGHVHERVTGQNIVRLSGAIRHWPFTDLAEQVQTNNCYSTLAAQDLCERGKAFTWLHLIFKPLSKFIETYVVKRGFLDGGPGFVIAVGAAYSMFLKYAKLHELKSQKKNV